MSLLMMTLGIYFHLLMVLFLIGNSLPSKGPSKLLQFSGKFLDHILYVSGEHYKYLWLQLVAKVQVCHFISELFPLLSP